MTLSKRSVFERYQKNENDVYVIAIVTDEIVEDNIVIMSNTKEVSILESEILGSSWNEDTICSKYSLIRRASFIQPELVAMESIAKATLESSLELVSEVISRN